LLLIWVALISVLCARQKENEVQERQRLKLSIHNIRALKIRVLSGRLQTFEN